MKLAMLTDSRSHDSERYASPILHDNQAEVFPCAYVMAFPQHS